MLSRNEVEQALKEVESEILMCIACGGGVARLIELQAAKTALLQLLVNLLDRKAA